MRIIYFDIDTLRPDYLGCYGYHRKTSSNIDTVAEKGVRFTNCYTSNPPCGPSRTVLWGGQFGFHTGVEGHGGTAADDITPFAIHWIDKNAHIDNWFLHINCWDPHTPYRTPEEYREPFKDDPLPDWLAEEVRQKHWQGCGSWSAQERMRYGGPHPYVGLQYPRQPNAMSSMQEVRRMFNGYDTGIRYTDDHIGKILNALTDQNVLEETAIIISADHGENLGELNIYYDHQTADNFTANILLIIHWTGVTDRCSKSVDRELHYQFDLADTVVELVGGEIPASWDAVSFADTFRKSEHPGRDYLVLTQATHTCQHSVRFGDYLCIRFYHDGFHNFSPLMLFNLKNDPYEQCDMAKQLPELVGRSMTMFTEWQMEMMQTSTQPADPLFTVMKECRPLHTRDGVREYIERLKNMGRGICAEALFAAHSEIEK